MMRLFSLGPALAVLAAAAPAVAQSRDQFNNLVPPALNYDDPAGRDLYKNGSYTALQQLQQICSSSTLRDRLRCNQAWREINAAYARIQAAKAPASANQ